MKAPQSPETDLIRRFFARGDRPAEGAIGIGDDAAVTRLPPGTDLVSATDTIVAGVHFPAETAAGDIGWRALAVNLSDLAAMGATPQWALLALALPDAEDSWLGEFSAGFFELAEQHDVSLIGGDLVRAPLSATVTALGSLPAGAAVTRSGLSPGDLLFVTGVPGSAARGLDGLLGRGDDDAGCRRAFLRPVPRIAEGISLRGIASAMIDVSDGLLTDAAHLARASGCAIEIDEAALAGASVGHTGRALSGGDDYELLFAVPAGHEPALERACANWSCPVSRIGVARQGKGICVPGFPLDTLSGFDHFGD